MVNVPTTSHPDVHRHANALRGRRSLTLLALPGYSSRTTRPQLLQHICLQRGHLSGPVMWTALPATPSPASGCLGKGMTMTTDKEQEAFGLVIERHQSGASENDIRYSFQRFLETVDLAAATEMPTEVQPGQGNSGQMDLYVHNTCIEFKKHILHNGAPIPSYVAQLDSYLDKLLKAGTGRAERHSHRRRPLLPAPCGRGKTALAIARGPPDIRPAGTSTPPTRVPPRNHHGSGREHRPNRREPKKPFRQRLRRLPRRQSALAGSLPRAPRRPDGGGETPALAGPAAGGAGQKRRRCRRRKRLDVHQAHLHHQSDSRHHAAATPGRRRTTRR